ncbi:T9SS C-terminal target domain-containing protein [candidate division KSB1 bacterium]|nr:MAG: T9SS C-terminal target domain-containing protein [candidate division KSB1 bacterium]
MRKLISVVLFLAATTGVVSLAYGINYAYFSDRELTRFGDRIKFWSGDTLTGPIRSNDTIAIMGTPCFYDFFISSAGDYWHTTNPDPQYSYPPVFSAPRLEIPPNASHFRQLAIEQGHYFNAGPSMTARVEIREDSLRIWWRLEGTPLDTSQFIDYPLPDSAVVFFNCPLTLFGTVSTNLILGAGGTVGLEDNVRYISADPLTGAAPADHSERFVLIAEGDIKVLNTPANGRENSAGLGNIQTNPDSTDIVLDGIYVALNESFTFAQQNDPDSGYVCQCQPDDRGTIHLYGSLIQKRRGYVHRSTNSSTGYLKQYRYDNSLRRWNFGLWNLRENVAEPAQLDFGDVPLGSVRTDTIHIYNDYIPVDLHIDLPTEPFFCPMEYDTYAFQHDIFVSLTTTDTGFFEDSLRIYNEYYNLWTTIPLRAHIYTPSPASSFILPPSSYNLSAFPNPFNATAKIQFTLPREENAVIEVFNIQGRLVSTLVNNRFPAGAHSVSFNGSNLSSGIYLCRMQAGSFLQNRKLILLK